MLNQTWTNIDKTSWTPGPWNDEPDKEQWTDADTGMSCLLKRNKMGFLCGYVGVGKAHPLHGLSNDHADCIALDVHGGLTFADACMPDPEGPGHGICHTTEPGDEDPLWWFGFDCGHCNDLMPNLGGELENLPKNFGIHDGDIYRDVAYVKDECSRLAQQLKATMKCPT